MRQMSYLPQKNYQCTCLFRHGCRLANCSWAALGLKRHKAILELAIFKQLASMCEHKAPLRKIDLPPR